MSSSTDILLRIQSTDGIKRVEISPNSSVQDLYDKIHNVLKLTDYGFALFKERNFSKELVASRSKTILSHSFKNGDILYLKQISGTSRRTSASILDVPEQSDKILTPILDKISIKFQPSPKNIEAVEDEIDVVLSKMDGRIERGRDTKLCRHNSNGCCVHCSPLEPYDEAYLKEQNIKHLSFHSYLRKQTSGVDGGKYVAFDDLNCKIKPGCREHPPWPKGICSKCQPSAITLNRQIYRHVDNVMFENTALVERFLNYWRSTGHQRMGFLYGKYEAHTDVPLGIRARVAAIYEPPQESSRDAIKLLDDEYAAAVDEVANILGLKKVGWIFTDLISEDASCGTVKQIRGIETHFLSAHECIMAGNFQNEHPNHCKSASNCVFGSKFVTVCVTGDKTKQVHMEGYAVSAQCMALVRDDLFIPTKDAPELGYIRESSENQYVPDVFYKEKDDYGNEVQRLARPLPVEYLLVDVPASTPLTPMYTFTANGNKEPFPIENRLLDGHLQDFNALSAYLGRWGKDEFLDAISDFHLLIYLYKMDMLPMKANMGSLLEAVKNKDKELANNFKTQEVWMTLESLIAASSSSSGGTGSYPDKDATEAAAANWTCNHCTFINRSELTSCEICSLPK